MASDGTPMGKNDSAALTAFNERKFYRDETYPYGDGFPTPIDMWYDKPFYGRMTPGGTPIFPNDTFLKKLNTNTENIMALDFVALAFQDLKEYYAAAANMGQVQTVGSHIAILEARGGWASLNKNHLTYVNALFTGFTSTYLASNHRDEQISSFKDYVKIFQDFISQLTPNYPFTKAGFISSQFCTPNISGLIVEIAEAEAANDHLKYTDFINDVNFSFYVHAAQKFGFKIDKNAPWCLVADLGSPVMENYMRQFPEPPNIDPPKFIGRFAVGDIVRLKNLYDDPTIDHEKVMGARREAVRKKAVRKKASKKKASKKKATKRKAHRISFRIPEREILFRVVDIEGGNVILSALPSDEWKVDILKRANSKFLEEALTIGVPPTDLQTVEEATSHEDPTPKQLWRRAVEQYLNTPKLSLSNLFEKRYFKAYMSDFESLKVYMLEFYNSHVKSKPTITRTSISTCEKEKIIQKTVLRKPISFEEMTTIYKDSFWLLMYTQIRMREINMFMPKHKIQKFRRTVKKYSKDYSNLQVLRYINTVLNGCVKPLIPLTPPEPQIEDWWGEGFDLR